MVNADSNGAMGHLAFLHFWFPDPGVSGFLVTCLKEGFWLTQAFTIYFIP